MMEKRKRKPPQVVLEFVAPYPMEECIERLERKKGRHDGKMLGVSIDLVDATGEHHFHLYSLDRWRREFQVVSSGYLKPQEDGSTLVTLYRSDLWLSPREGQAIGAMLAGGVAFAFAAGNLLPLLLFGGGVLFYWYTLRQRRDELEFIAAGELGYNPFKSKRN